MHHILVTAPDLRVCYGGPWGIGYETLIAEERSAKYPSLLEFDDVGLIEPRQDRHCATVVSRNPAICLRLTFYTEKWCTALYEISGGVVR
jgi:hypothetical protein